MKKYMKRMMLLFPALLLSVAAWACPACEKQQPRILRGITHGTGPQSNWDYVIVYIAVGIVLFTLFFSVKWLIRPGERSENHIKRFVLEQE
ncbi:hypothetical protein FW774_11395 [Pedobacter sp. BS3]|uniref:hypothetical protein n=1 Tax=Pedobacter sp. BS3 TaxID=2567937 RepID=UPI0011EFF8EF|nr:hypothetical protein [Pedobacter sp. BS3]TZF84041.1 hypothetical protein FW774_11395 [Pedobacter sp. BS3]